MGFTGRLDRFPLPDVLQILSSTGKTGTLTLTLRFDQGLLVLRRGKIIYAASTSSRQTLGSVLVARGLISESQLARALEELLDSSREARLGTILIERGLLDPTVLSDVIADQVRSVLAEFIEWKGAYFRFEAMQIPDHGEVEVDAKDFLLEHGLAAEEVLFDLLARAEEPEADRPVEAPPSSEGPVASLWSIMSGIQPPEFTGELTLKILEQSRQVMQRGVLFGVTHDGFRRMSHFGIHGIRPEEVLRSTRLTHLGDSILARVLQSQAPFRGPIGEGNEDRALLEGLGGGRPGEAVAIPMVVGGRVVAIVYGDGGPEGEALGSTELLEIQLAEISLRIERSALEKRLRHIDQLRRRYERAPAPL